MSARNSTAELFRFVFYRLWRRKPVSIARGIWINLTSLKRINLIKIHRVEITCKIGKRNVPIRPIYNQFVDRTNSYWNAADLLYSTRFNQFDSLRWFDLRRQSVDWNVQFQIKKKIVEHNKKCAEYAGRLSHWLLITWGFLRAAQLHDGQTHTQRPCNLMYT